MKTLPTNKIDLASRWRPQPAVGGPSQPRRVAKFLFKIQCPSQPLAAPASCIRMLHSSCSKSSAPHLAFASARLMALRRLVAVLPTSSQYPPNLFPTSSLFLSNLNLRPDILIVIRPASVRRHLGVGGRTFGLEAAPLSWGPLLSEIR